MKPARPLPRNTSRPVAVMWDRLFARHARANLGLQGQIRSMMVSAILDGQLPGDQPLPSSRDLADRLGVARNTVVLAYQQLVDEGYLVARERSGYFVNGDMLRGRVRLGRERDAHGAPARPARDGHDERPAAPRDAALADDVLPTARRRGPHWTSRFRVQPTQQRNIVKPQDWQRYPYPFLYGQFDPTLFPTTDWRECCARALSVVDIRSWAPDLIVHDDALLIEQIRTRVLPRRGVFAAADEIVITVGAQHALYLLADLFARPQTRVGIEDPCYPDARNIFLARTPHVQPIAVDADGVPVGEVLRGIDYLVVTPSHQCPTTVTMPLVRRHALLAAAEASDFVIIEDDYETENSFDGEPIPALKSLDRDDRVIYIGSLSKTFAPGLRVGYIVAPAPVVAELRGLRRLMLRHPSAFVQRAFALFLSMGHYDALLRRLSLAYHERAQAMAGGLATHLPDCRVVPVAGGSSCWVQGPPALDSERLALAAEQVGVLIEPGGVFFADPDPPRHCFRLGFSAIGVGQIEPGLRELGAVVERLRALCG
jgi:GntR family transcriptional regulator / MocR family aminotransferase